MADQFLLAIAGFEAAAVGIADEAGSIENQNHTLRSVEDLLIEIALALQLRLEHFLLGDIEHEAADLNNAAMGIADGADVLKGVEKAAVLAAENFFVVSKVAALGDGANKAILGGAGGIEMGADVGAEEFFAGIVAKHADHGVIDIEELAIRGGKEEAFLNVVEEFAITAFCFTAIANVLENVDRASFFFRGAPGARSGDEKGAVFTGGDVFLARFVGVLTERAGKSAASLGDVAQVTHGFANKGNGRNAEMRGERAVGADNVPRLVVNDDVVADGVDVLDPLLFGALQLGKATNLFHDQGGVAGQSGKKAFFFGGEAGGSWAKAKGAHQFMVTGVDRKESTESILTRPRQDLESGPAEPDLRGEPVTVGLVAKR